MEVHNPVQELAKFAVRTKFEDLPLHHSEQNHSMDSRMYPWRDNC
jgi:hypothetical protein